MRTVGISLAAPVATAACVIDWESSSERAEIISWTQGLEDGELTELVDDPIVSKVGIDAPFGWPIGLNNPAATFKEKGEPRFDESNIRASEMSLWREFREIDPSMWFSRRSWTRRFHQASRCTALLSRWSCERGTKIDRTGEGRFAEVYPGAALARWGIKFHGVLKDYYQNGIKEGTTKSQRIVVGALQERLGSSLVLSVTQIDRCVDRHRGGFMIDALISALVARSLVTGRCDPIPPDCESKARSEGWVMLPKGPDLRADLLASS